MPEMTRREWLGSAAVAGGWLTLQSEQAFGRQDPPAGSQMGTPTGPYSLPPLPYDYADLEPHIDAQTLKLHHDLHHAGYVSKANAAVAELARIRRTGGEEIFKVRSATDALAFNVAGHVLHSIYWQNMKKDGGGDPPAGSEIARLIRRDFASNDHFRGHFQAAAQQVQGSGWGLLAYEPLAERLIVLQAEKHQNTTVSGVVPLLVLDVWEHAYYLSYQNKRSSYIKAFMNVVNWDDVERRLQAALKLRWPEA